jgi:hypothetical protein
MRLRFRAVPRSAASWAALLLVLAAVAAAGGAPAAVKPAPRIVAAALQDVDRDFRADTLRLTYSQPIRHAADADGAYPFSVAGYRIRAVGPANGRALVIRLIERSKADPAARPLVRYRTTRSKPVRSAAGKGAGAQIFRQTRPHGRKPPAVLPPAPRPPAPPPPGATDRDGDGFPDSQDCAPLDRAINPGAADLPDLGFVDSNCDGIDGREAAAVFVSPLGRDANPGTKAAPKRQIATAVLAAAGTGRVVLAAAGDYSGAVAVTGAGIYGGYDGSSWRRSTGSTTRLVGSPEGLLVDGATGVVVQLVTVVGIAGVTDASAYGIRAVNGAAVTLQRVVVNAGGGLTGARGANGRAGPNGAAGARGQEGTAVNSLGDCVSFGRTAKGGRGGDSTVARIGGDGGDGGPDGSNAGKPGKEGRFGTPGGAAGSGGRPGKPGKDGADGSGPGAAGSGGDGGTATTRSAGATWRGSGGGTGRLGISGNGGGGGGGGGGRGGLFVFDMAGHSGGGGGGGGAPGSGGEGGLAGGGSFGIYLFNSTLTAEESTIVAGNGGAGGTGGNGGGGGKGGAGGVGEGASARGCPHFVGRGGNGGRGGDGGVGGAGGGGAGGPSVGVMRIGSAATLVSTTVRFGAAGPGGARGTGGSADAAPSQAGVAQAVFP